MTEPTLRELASCLLEYTEHLYRHAWVLEMMWKDRNDPNWRRIYSDFAERESLVASVDALFAESRAALARVPSGEESDSALRELLSKLPKPPGIN